MASTGRPRGFGSDLPNESGRAELEGRHNLALHLGVI